MAKVTLTCENCSNEFQRDSWDVKRGRTKFCSYKCYYESMMGHPSYAPDPTEERTCEVCGKTFLVGGRGRPPKKQKLCSDECQRVSRFRHGEKAKELSPVDAAYLAGFMDGEGSIMLTPRRDKVSVKLSATNTDLNILEWITEVTGVGNVSKQHLYSENRRQTWFFYCNSDAAISIIEQILPYLKIKSEQAKLAIETQRRLRIPALNADRTWQAEYIRQMKAMNRRGPDGTDKNRGRDDLDIGFEEESRRDHAGEMVRP